MLDLRSVGYLLGLIVAALGAAMFLPVFIDLRMGNGSWPGFLQSALATLTCGGLVALACHGGGGGFGPKPSLVLAVLIFTLVPGFGALPYLVVEPRLGPLDAWFEAVSALTTTGATLMTGLQDLPAGLQLWRGMLGWFGGLGFIGVALVLLPQLRVGGMSYFRAATFDGSGHILPRVVQAGRDLALFYPVMTLLCALVYLALGMAPLAATVAAMSTLSTSGIGLTDASFTGQSTALHLAAVLFMLVASMPYLRLVQALSRAPGPLARDPQVRAYLLWLLLALALVLAYRLSSAPDGRASLVEALFNLVSVFSGTGFRSGDFALWGPFVVVVALVLGVIGGCTGSTSSGLGLFRVLVLRGVIRAQIARVQMPHRVALVRYDGRSVSDEVIDQVLIYIGGYFAALVGLSILLAATGIGAGQAVLMVWACLSNIGGFFGAGLAPGATMSELGIAGKLLLMLAMLIGRLGLVGLLVLASRRFWVG